MGVGMVSMRQLKEEHLGRVVEVYFNLHRKCWSVRDARTRRVLGHTWRVHLESATFKVSAAGRERVRREKKKNVHAWVRGVLTGWDTIPCNPWSANVYEAYYNPYHCETFMRKGTQVPLHQADRVYMNSNRQVVYC